MADINICKEFGKKNIALSYEVSIQIATAEAYLRIAVYGETELGRSLPAEGH